MPGGAGVLIARRARGVWLVALLAVISMAGAACGSWQVSSTPTPVEAIHVALLHTGKVLLVAGSGADKAKFDAGTFRTSIWDPATNAFESVSTPWDAFCSGHAFLPDGRLLVSGGTADYPTPSNGIFAGTNTAYTFDPVQKRYRSAPDSAVSRWYPTIVELGDGRLFTVGGFDERRARSRQSEIFDGTQWSTPKDPPGNVASVPTYPALHLMADGRLFYSGANVLGTAAMEAGLWNVTTNQYEIVPGLPKKGSRDEGMSVLLPPAQDQRVLIIGGGRSNGKVLPTETTAIIDLKDQQPGYVPGPSLDVAKLYVSAVILPNSTVLETGGAATAVKDGNNPVYSAQIFDPKTDTWSRAATPTVPRVYHSSAMLLPDGRVATFGGNPIGSFEYRIEIYTPAYLGKGTPRPTITSGPTEIAYGGSYGFGTTQASALKSAVLIRPAAVTHSSDSNQRLVSLGMTTTATGVSVSVASNPNLAPPGWYMLFVNDSTGVPSVARWVHLA
jgi:hypothetical protein